MGASQMGSVSDEIRLEFHHRKALRIQYAFAAMMLAAILFPLLANWNADAPLGITLLVVAFSSVLSVLLYIFLVELVRFSPKCVCSDTGISIRSVWGCWYRFDWNDICRWSFHVRGQTHTPAILQIVVQNRFGNVKRYRFFVGELTPGYEALRDTLKKNVPSKSVK
jgi:hypothetical protein